MLTLAQLNNNQKPQSTSHSLVDKEPPAAAERRNTYRFIKIRSGSFRSKSKEIRLHLDSIDDGSLPNDLYYDFRRLSVDSVDDETCAQFKV